MPVSVSLSSPNCSSPEHMRTSVDDGEDGGQDERELKEREAHDAEVGWWVRG